MRKVLGGTLLFSVICVAAFAVPIAPELTLMVK